MSEFKWNDWHEAIETTFEQGGTPAGEKDDGISNESNAWLSSWSLHLGGPDLEGSRALVLPGLDNLFYGAVPCPDFNSNGLLTDNISMSPWDAPPAGQSAFKNRWIEVKYHDQSVFVQWEDVGPLPQDSPDDCDYVFKGARPAYLTDPNDVHQTHSGLDISPLAFKRLTGLTTLAEIQNLGLIVTNWRFVDAADVPPGDWLANVTTGPPNWNE